MRSSSRKAPLRDYLSGRRRLCLVQYADTSVRAVKGMVGSSELTNRCGTPRDLPARRLQDRIHQLSEEISFTKDLHEFVMLKAEIESAIAEFIWRIENRASAAVIGWPEFP